MALAADHVVRMRTLLFAACMRALPPASAGYIIRFGIDPARPSAEYGYICPGAPCSEDVRLVERFVEKPDVEVAAAYVGQGFLWNSGNFLFRAQVLLDEYELADRDSLGKLQETMALARDDRGFVVLDAAAFGKVTPISIDYAVVERTTRAAVVPLAAGWSDVGSWRAAWELSDKDGFENAATGPAIFENAHRCNVVTDRALVALEVVSDLSVVATSDAVLISRQQDAGAMKRLVSNVKRVDAALTEEEHVSVRRRWGSCLALEKGERHQVRRIAVNPGAPRLCNGRRTVPGTGLFLRAQPTLRSVTRVQ